MSDTWSQDLKAPQVRGPSLEALFSYGFRPFFLGAAIFAVISMSVWLAYLSTALTGLTSDWLNVAGSPFAWHAHEMVFGFAAAAIAGFLLTAVPNWTGTLPLSGAPLAALFALWVAGRVTMLLSGFFPPWTVAAVDIAFIPALGAFAALQLFVKPAPRNLVFLLLLMLMMAGNVLYHAENLGLVAFDPLRAARAGMLMVAVMIAIIGGRIVPAFTHNWMHLQRPNSTMPRRIVWLDQVSILSIATFAVLAATGVPEIWQGAAASVAAVVNGARLYLWRGWLARREPIVWILHLGYAWLVLGLGLSAAAAFGAGIPSSLASHAFGTGVAGTMIMAVMSRASLGHTGRPLAAAPRIVWAYGLVTLAAVLRVFGPLIVPGRPDVVLTLAALAWIGAFSLFVVVYTPILTTPRVHTRVA